MVTFDRKDLIKYPFLKEAQGYISDKTASLETFLNSHQGKMAVREAFSIIENAINFSSKDKPPVTDPPSDPDSTTILIASYPMTRLLLSCHGDRSLIDKTMRYLSGVMASRLSEEEFSKKEYVCHSLNLPVKGGKIPVITYIEITSRIPDSRWRLINRIVENGMVSIRADEIDDLLRERLRTIMSAQLPLHVPKKICELFSPALKRIETEWQARILQEFGSVEESAFPPCIQAIIQALAAHGPLTHMGRFALTAFLHNIGMENTRIVEIFGHVPDFVLQKTMYQVEHISGRSGSSTEYTSPQCATMRTHSLCIHPDPLCKKINHPLSYYKMKKKTIETEKKQKKSNKIAVLPKSGADIPDNIPPDTDDPDKKE